MSDAMIARGELLPPEHFTGALSGPATGSPSTRGFSISEEFQRLRDEERW